jgi:hypothetical protein
MAKVDIDDQLLIEALRIGGHSTRRATLTEALREYIGRRAQRRIVTLFGAIDFDPTHDYKEQRRKN